MTDRTEFKSGETIILTQGAYSDYYIIGLFKVLKDFSAKDFMDTSKPMNRWRIPRLLYTDLVIEGYLEDVDHTELWVGD